VNWRVGVLMPVKIYKPVPTPQAEERDRTITCYF
jgi:hypothetical protein